MKRALRRSTSSACIPSRENSVGSRGVRKGPRRQLPETVETDADLDAAFAKLKADAKRQRLFGWYMDRLTGSDRRDAVDAARLAAAPAKRAS